MRQRREPVEWRSCPPFRILSIDGGGIKGVFPAAILSYLELRCLNGKTVGDYFDLICRNIHEYDADIQIVMNPNDNWGPKDYIKAIYDTLRQNKNYADKVKLGTRCVTIDYAGDFHLDIVPRVTIDGEYYICNRDDNEFEETNGAGYRDWFNGQNKITDGNQLRFVLMAGQNNEVTQADALIEDMECVHVVADKGYDADWLREHITCSGTPAVIPPKSNRKQQYVYDEHIYKERHLIECLFNKARQFRRVFSYYDIYADTYLNFLQIARTLIWLK